MSDVDLQKLKKLFQEKKYSEVIFEIEKSTTEKNKIGRASCRERV